MLKKKALNSYCELFRNHRIFKDISYENLEKILSSFSEEKRPENSCSITSQGTLNHFYLIVSGRLKMYQVDATISRELTLFLLKDQDCFDTLCLLENCEHKVYFETLDEVKLLWIPMQKMRQYLKQFPQIGLNLLGYMATQMRQLEEYATNITFVDISTRLAKLIVKNLNGQSRKLESINDLSNEEIANLIGSTRAVVNRHLQEFKHDGILKLGRNKVELENLNLLLQKLKNGENSSQNF